MSNWLGRAAVFLGHLLWCLACIPGWIAFRFASRNVKRAQVSVLRRILRANAETEFGGRHGFETLAGPEDYRSTPLSEYEDFADSIEAIRTGEAAVLTGDAVELLQPTSGSTAASKLIPYTKSLKEEFKAAIDPWIASLYLARPSIMFGRHYWSISPTTAHPEHAGSRVPVGFADDSAYLGLVQRLLSRVLLAVPREISRVTDHEAFQHLSLLFLCRARDLRLVSVWHASFLTSLLGAIPRRLPSIIRDLESGAVSNDIDIDSDLRCALNARLAPDPKRAQELRRIDATAPTAARDIWPDLRVISCWTDGVSEPWVTELARLFPRAIIQGKGLTATEGIVSFPIDRSGRNVCAVRSHFFEFIDIATGDAHGAWELEDGKEYSVVLTTSGGLYRYRLHDVVRVTGFFNQAPCFSFIARDNLVSDLVGEKLNAKHVEESIRRVEAELGFHFRFAMVAPTARGDATSYSLYAQVPRDADPDFERVAALLESELSHNYHYRHARGLSQLQQLRVFRIDERADVAAIYRRYLLRRGVRSGDIKFQLLSPDSAWSGELPGEYVA